MIRSTFRAVFFIAIISSVFTACSEDEDAVSVPVTSISISGLSDDMSVGDSAQLSARVLPEGATNQAVTWSVDDPSVATVSEEGMIVVMKSGEVTVVATAKDGSGVTGKKTMTIAEATLTEPETVAVSAITLTGEDILEGDSAQIESAVMPENADDKTIVWSTSDKTVATITEGGMLTGLKPGKVTVIATAKDGSGVTKELEVTVKPIVLATSIVLSFSQSESKFTATVLPQDVTNDSVTWSVSDESVATVDENGKLNSKKNGKVIVTATAQDGSKVVNEFELTVSEFAEAKNEFTFEGKSYDISEVYFRKMPDNQYQLLFYPATLKYVENDGRYQDKGNGDYVRIDLKALEGETISMLEAADYKREDIGIFTELVLDSQDGFGNKQGEVDRTDKSTLSIKKTGDTYQIDFSLDFYEFKDGKKVIKTVVGHYEGDIITADETQTRFF